jgi:hypothetical protein
MFNFSASAALAAETTGAVSPLGGISVGVGAGAACSEDCPQAVNKIATKAKARKVGVHFFMKKVNLFVFTYPRNLSSVPVSLPGG